MATYTLNITFTGLCLFVPEPATGTPDTGRMTVLMPKPGPHHHHGMDRHVPVLGFDVAHAGAGAVITGTHAYTAMRGLQFIHPGEQANLTLCPEMVNLADATGKSVDADHLGADQTRKLVSRVRLGAGRISAVGRGFCWEWAPGQIRSIAHKVRWTIENMPGTELNLQLTGLHAGRLVNVPALRPLNGEINLTISHVPQGDLLPEPEPHHEPPAGAEPPHFSTFYSLFGPDPKMRLPRYAAQTCSTQPGPCPEIVEMGPSAFTCMVAAVKVG